MPQEDYKSSERAIMMQLKAFMAETNHMRDIFRRFKRDFTTQPPSSASFVGVLIPPQCSSVVGSSTWFHFLFSSGKDDSEVAASFPCLQTFDGAAISHRAEETESWAFDASLGCFLDLKNGDEP